jgi:hypothetical protein
LRFCGWPESEASPLRMERHVPHAKPEWLSSRCRTNTVVVMFSFINRNIIYFRITYPRKTAVRS